MNITWPFMTLATPIYHVYIFSSSRLSKAIAVEIYILIALNDHFNFFLNNIDSDVCDIRSLPLKTALSCAYHPRRQSAFTRLVSIANSWQRCANLFIRCMACKTLEWKCSSTIVLEIITFTLYIKCYNIWTFSFQNICKF